MLSKMKKNLLILFTAIGLLSTSCSKSSQTDYKDASLSIDERVDALLPLLSIEEKVAQMRIFHALIGVESDGEGNLKLSDNVAEKLKLGIAGIKNPGEHLSPLAAAKLNNELQKYIIEHNRWGIPALFVIMV